MYIDQFIMFKKCTIRPAGEINKSKTAQTNLCIVTNFIVTHVMHYNDILFLQYELQKKSLTIYL